MRRRYPAILLGLLLALLAMGLGARTLAAQPTPAGPETLVSGAANDSVPCPRLGVAANGSFEIAWEHPGNPSSFMGTHYVSSGSPTDPGPVEIGAVGRYTTAEAVTPVTGGFRVLAGVNPYEPQPAPHFYQIPLDASGAPEAGGPQPLGSGATRWIWPGPGDSLLAGQQDLRDGLIKIQRLSPAGQPAGPLSALNTQPIVDPYPYVQVVPLADGGWIGVYAGSSRVGPRLYRGVFRARRFSPAGRPVGQGFDVSSRLGAPFAVAANPSGGFAIAWAYTTPTNDPNDIPVVTVFLRFFNAAGRPLGPEIAVDQGQRVGPPISAAFDDSGRLLLLWPKGSFRNGFFRLDLQGQLFGSGGTPAGPAFVPSSAASGELDQSFCGSVAWADHSWWIVWTAGNNQGTGAILLRRFNG
ncbi:MAG TPA: hypothetical protein VGH73_03120 [Thermoanaerobaculia bacterium]|jgi:hypothetical protein